MIFLLLRIIFLTIGLNSYYSRVDRIVSCKVKLQLCNISCKFFMYECFWVCHYCADLINMIQSHLMCLMIFFQEICKMILTKLGWSRKVWRKGRACIPCITVSSKSSSCWKVDLSTLLQYFEIICCWKICILRNVCKNILRIQRKTLLIIVEFSFHTKIWNNP